MRIKFVDFWFDDFELKWFYVFNDILSEMYDIETVKKNPDVLFFSSFGEEYLQYSNCKKIFYTAEVRSKMDERKRFSGCDYSFSFHSRPDDSTHYRFPSWVFWREYGNLDSLTNQRNGGKILGNKQEFCSFLYSNDFAQERIKFFKELSKYKQVNSGGDVLNNIGHNVEQGKDVNWTSKHKFSICFENRKSPGYVTEKIFRTFLAKSIPIYWGSEYAKKDFNPDSFIYVEDLNDMSYYIEKIKELNKNNDKYKHMISQFPFKNGVIPQQWTEETLKDKFREIFD